MPIGGDALPIANSKAILESIQGTAAEGLPMCSFMKVLVLS